MPTQHTSKVDGTVLVSQADKALVQRSHPKGFAPLTSVESAHHQHKELGSILAETKDPL